MELANIEKLLDKYLDAETTLQEENILRNYFTTGNVAPHLQEYGMMFGYFKQNKSETYTKTIQLKPENTRKKNWKWLTVAASVALLISVFIGRQEYNKYQQRKQFAQIKEALEQVSFNLNKGNDVLYAVSDNLNKGNDALYAVSNNLNKGNDAVTKLRIYEETANTVIKKVNY
ncbi:hypothetical protein C7447_102518 [Tenacibaculum adriaticum]|uniref:Uncharacterized protein n=1 Tax=Tenacibaculum adriaticum TaxID=413713 RepID=A0A5S5DTJ3_9FLAO|nr:hypothetical protein [Tenacibaculum adriaticum]TYP99197.1 hypothetical protein C7447_102518 [Tenacibaculum adriaticum]